MITRCQKQVKNHCCIWSMNKNHTNKFLFNSKMYDKIHNKLDITSSRPQGLISGYCELDTGRIKFVSPVLQHLPCSISAGIIIHRDFQLDVSDSCLCLYWLKAFLNPHFSIVDWNDHRLKWMHRLAIFIGSRHFTFFTVAIWTHSITPLWINFSWKLLWL